MAKKLQVNTKINYKFILRTGNKSIKMVRASEVGLDLICA